ncbi:MAG: hypothetical protein KatS3mg105_3231 [Gemmatales bacterium]|nr:MAG: hypothetical protein KatS3mg105_3231 [Gemmatales bacterium]
MPATAGFKQQCPSCEERVLIKDEKLVGKKVECPKCKFRFVVQAPAEKKRSQPGFFQRQKKEQNSSHQVNCQRQNQIRYQTSSSRR